MRLLTNLAVAGCVFALAKVGASTAPAASHTDRPVIGILSVPVVAGGCTTAFGDDTVQDPSTKVASTSCFDDVYVKWVESAGARVVPVRYDSTPAELDHLFDSLNGVLFTGGGVPFTDLSVPYVRPSRKCHSACCRDAWCGAECWSRDSMMPRLPASYHGHSCCVVGISKLLDTF